MKLKFEFAVNEVAGQFIAVPVGEGVEKLGGFIKTDNVGAFILETLKEETSLDELVAKLKAEFPDAPENEVVDTATEFTEKLRGAGIID